MCYSVEGDTKNTGEVDGETNQEQSNKDDEKSDNG